jgi:hypothetical protein
MRTLLLLITSWGAGLAAYTGALRGLYGESISKGDLVAVGLLTLIAWLLASELIILPILRRLSRRASGQPSGALLAAVGIALAVVPVWLTLALWGGWHPRHLISQEAGLFGALYGVSGAVLGLSLARIASQRAA